MNESEYYLVYAMCQELFQAGNITLNKTNKNPCLHKVGILVSNDRKYKITKLSSLLVSGQSQRGKKSMVRRTERVRETVVMLKIVKTLSREEDTRWGTHQEHMWKKNI